MVMESQPPNDPNRNGNNNNNQNHQRAKEQPFDGNNRRGSRNRQQDGQPMDIIGDLNESPAVVMMFLVGVAAWFLRERCVC
jgi:hypothetical protein